MLVSLQEFDLVWDESFPPPPPHRLDKTLEYMYYAWRACTLGAKCNAHFSKLHTCMNIMGVNHSNSVQTELVHGSSCPHAETKQHYVTLVMRHVIAVVQTFFIITGFILSLKNRGRLKAPPPPPPQPPLNLPTPM